MNGTPRTEILQSKLHQAIALFRQGQLGAARALCEEILKQQPKHYVTLNLSGSIALREGDPKRALVLFGKAIALDPRASAAHGNRGVALLDLGDLTSALASLDQAIVLDPMDADAHLNRGNVLRASWQLEAALASYDRALEIRPHFIEAHTNRGIALVQLARYAEARASLDRAIAFEPDHPPALFNRGLLRLLLGDFAGGWADYEWRFRLAGPPSTRPPSTRPPSTSPSSTRTSAGRSATASGSGSVSHRYERRRWSGSEPLEGRRILLYAEQGFGDTIQFARYIEQVAALGARITLEVQPQLADLLGKLPGVSALITGSEPEAFFDYQCPLMSLPKAFGTRLDSIPSKIPYLRCDPARVARWQERLGARAHPLIGLAWSGRATHWNDRNRSLSLGEYLECLPPGFQYVSLQKDVREADRKTWHGRRDILDVARELRDFSDTAALCECLDLIVTVDSSLAHLGGALGRNTWVLVPFNPDWRWLLERCDSPWYPTMKLYRQPGIGEWAAVLDRVRADLLEGRTRGA